MTTQYRKRSDSHLALDLAHQFPAPSPTKATTASTPRVKTWPGLTADHALPPKPGTCRLHMDAPTQGHAIIPFAATWMHLEIIILSEESQTEKDRWYAESKKKKNDTNKLIYKTETDLQTLKRNLWLPKVKDWGERQIRSLGLTYIRYYI